MKTAIPSTLALATLAFVATHASAADGARRGCIELKTVAETEVVEVDAQGQRTTRLVPAAKVVPGTQVVWTVTAANVCDKPAEKVAQTVKPRTKSALVPLPGADGLAAAD